MFKKALATLVILLFLGLAISPSINANKSNLDDFVELNVNFLGLGKKSSITLTVQEKEEIQQIFNDLRMELSDENNYIDTIKIIKKSLFKLHSYGLFGDLDFEQVESLILDKPNYDECLNPILSSLDDRGEIFNSNCILVGQCTKPRFQTYEMFVFDLLASIIFGPPIYIIMAIFVVLFILRWDFPILEMLLPIINAISEKFNQIFADFINREYRFGEWEDAHIWLGGDRGWIKTINGTNGNNSLNGTLWGQLDGFIANPAQGPAVIGFNGVHMAVNGSSDRYFIGNAEKVGVGNRPKS